MGSCVVIGSMRSQPIHLATGQRWLTSGGKVTRTILEVFPETAASEASVKFRDAYDRTSVVSVASMRSWIRRANAAIAP